jgi:hypothetical protein
MLTRLGHIAPISKVSNVSRLQNITNRLNPKPMPYKAGNQTMVCSKIRQRNGGYSLLLARITYPHALGSEHLNTLSYSGQGQGIMAIVSSSVMFMKLSVIDE